MNDADPNDPNRGETKETEPRPSGYSVVASAHATPDEVPLADQLRALIDERTVIEEPKPTGKPSGPKALFPPQWIERAQKFAENPTRLYATAGVGLGVLLVLIFMAIFWRSDAGRPFDLGLDTSSAVGLKGYLYVDWDKQLQYRLTVVPGDQSYGEGFSLAVTNPQRPLSIGIQLKDNHGFVLCSRQIVLKYDPHKAAVSAAPVLDAKPGKATAEAIAAMQSAQAAELARLDAQEAQREQGKDIFQNQIGSDGRVTTLIVQGVLPCAKKDYANIDSWSLTPDFPTLNEQDEWVKHEKELEAQAALPPALTPAERKAAIAAHKKAALSKILPFTVEGDDVIVELDFSRGVIETRGGKTFFIDKTIAAGADPRWQDFPISMHYRCDQNSNCALMHSGLGALRTRLRR
jgi:hypothetical protein